MQPLPTHDSGEMPSQELLSYDDYFSRLDDIMSQPEAVDGHGNHERLSCELQPYNDQQARVVDNPDDATAPGALGENTTGEAGDSTGVLQYIRLTWQAHFSDWHTFRFGHNGRYLASACATWHKSVGSFFPRSIMRCGTTFSLTTIILHCRETCLCLFLCSSACTSCRAQRAFKYTTKLRLDRLLPPTVSDS